jgi:hypothetical protein
VLRFPANSKKAIAGYLHINVLDISRQRVVFFRHSTTSGRNGIALNIVVVFSTVLLRPVATWTTMEIPLGVIARLKTVEETTISEYKPGEDFMPDEHWPRKGSVEFFDITASYKFACPRRLSVVNQSKQMFF